MALAEAYIARNLVTTPTKRKNSSEKSAHDQSAYITSLVSPSHREQRVLTESTISRGPSLSSRKPTPDIMERFSDVVKDEDVDIVLPSEVREWADIIRTYETSSDDLFMIEAEADQRRVVRAATLPAYIRSLTTMETTCQYDIWCLLLKLRTYVRPHDLLEFLYRRFVETWRCTPEQLGEAPAPTSIPMTGPGASSSRDDDSSSGTGEESDGSENSEWEGDAVLRGEAARQSIASSRAMMERFSRASSAAAAAAAETGGVAEGLLVEHDLDTSFLFQEAHVRGAQPLLFHDLRRAFERTEAEAAQATADTSHAAGGETAGGAIPVAGTPDEQELRYSMLSVRTAVLLFLETWLSQFPEDFLLPLSLMAEPVPVPEQPASRSYAEVVSSVAKAVAGPLPTTPPLDVDAITGFSVSGSRPGSPPPQSKAAAAAARVSAEAVLSRLEVETLVGAADAAPGPDAGEGAGPLPPKPVAPEEHKPLERRGTSESATAQHSLPVGPKVEAAAVVESQKVSPDPPEAELMDGLINFVRVFSYCSESKYWGISASEHLVSKPRRVAIPAALSLFQTHLPCLAHLRAVVEASDYAWSLIGMNSPSTQQFMDGFYLKHLPFPFCKLRSAAATSPLGEGGLPGPTRKGPALDTRPLRRLFSSGDLELMQQQCESLADIGPLGNNSTDPNNEGNLGMDVGAESGITEPAGTSVAVEAESNLPTCEADARDVRVGSGSDSLPALGRRRSAGTSTVSASAATIAVTVDPSLGGGDELGRCSEFHEREHWAGEEEGSPPLHRQNALVQQALTSRAAVKLVNYDKRKADKGGFVLSATSDRSASDGSGGGLTPASTRAALTGVDLRTRIGAAVDEFRSRRSISGGVAPVSDALGDMEVGMSGDAVEPSGSRSRGGSNTRPRARPRTRTRSRAASACAAKTEQQICWEELQRELQRERRLRAGYLLLSKDMKEDNDSLRLTVTKLLEDLVVQPLTDVCETYSDAAAVLMASELQSMQNYDRLNDFVPPPRIFSGDVDKHVLSSRSSVKCTRSVSTGKKVASALFAPLDISGCIRARRAGAPSPALIQNVYGLTPVKEDDHETYGGSSPSPVPFGSGASPLLRSPKALPGSVSTFSIETPKENTFFGSMFTKLFAKKGAREREEAAVDANMYTGFNDDMQCAAPQCLLLDIKPACIAVELTVRLHYLYATIPLYEFLCEFRSIKRVAVTVASATSIDYGTGGGGGTLQSPPPSGSGGSGGGRARTRTQSGTRSTTINSSLYNDKNDQRMLTRFRLESERLQSFFINEVLRQDDIEVRADAIMQLVSVAEYLLEMQSHHALMVIVGALQCQAVFRLKQTWHVVNNLMPGRLEAVNAAAGLGGAKLVAQDIERLSKKALSDDLRDYIAVRDQPPPLQLQPHVALVPRPLRASSRASTPPPMSVDHSVGIAMGSNAGDGLVGPAMDGSAATQAAGRDAELVSFRGVAEVYTPRRLSTAGSGEKASVAVPSALSSPSPGAGLAVDSKKVRSLDSFDSARSETPVFRMAESLVAEDRDVLLASSVQFDGEEDGEEVAAREREQSALGRVRCYTDDTGDTGTVRSSATASPTSSLGGALSDRSRSTSTGGGRTLPVGGVSASDRSVRSLLYAEVEMAAGNDELAPELAQGTAELVRQDLADGASAFRGEVRALLDDMIGRAAGGAGEEAAEGEVKDSEEASESPYVAFSCSHGSSDSIAELLGSSPGGTLAPVPEEVVGGEEGEELPAAVGFPTPTVPVIFQRLCHRYQKISVPLSGCVATAPVSGTEPSRTGVRMISPPRASHAHLLHYGRRLGVSPSARHITPREGQLGANNGGGIPVPLEQPTMPFVNGLIKKLVTLNEFPDYIRGNPSSLPAHNAFVDNFGINAAGLLVVQSPPSLVRSDAEPPNLLPVLNTGKVRAVANLLLIIRSTQITPFKDLVVHTELQGLLQGQIAYNSEENQWDRSCELEPNRPNPDDF